MEEIPSFSQSIPLYWDKTSSPWCPDSQWPGNCSFPLRVVETHHPDVMGWDGGAGKLRDFFPEDIHLAKGEGCQVSAFGVFLLDLFLFQVRHRHVFPNLLPRVSFLLKETVKWVCLLQQDLVYHPLSQGHGKQKQLTLISQAQSIPVASPPLHRCQTSCGRSRKWALHYVQLLGKSWSRKTTFGIFFLFSAVSQMEQQVPKIVMNNH